MRLARLALAAAALALAGCSSYNPLVTLGFKSEAANKPTPLAPINASANPRAIWTASVGKSRGFEFRPAYSGGRVYAASADGEISALDEDTGRVAFHFDAKKKLSGGVEVGDAIVVVGTLKGDVLAFDPAGKPLWTATVTGEVIAPPAVSNRIVVVRTSDSRIYAFDATDGKRKWVFQRPAPALLLRSDAGVLALGRDVVAGYPNGKLIALDLEDGKLTWEAAVSQPRGSTELERIADVAGLPVVDGNTACAGAFQGKIACFEISTRNMTWSHELSTARSLALDSKNVYAVDDTGAVQALGRSQGASVWKQDKLKYRKLTAPVVLDGRVVVGDYQGFLHVLSPDNGDLIGRLATDGTPVNSIVPIPGGLLVQTDGGSVLLVKI
jgi:outer membrane protein assembly factor BamB